MKRSRIVTGVALLIGVAHAASAADPRWGLLATPGFDAQPMKGVYFFSGEGACWPSDNDVPANMRPLGNPTIASDGVWPCHLVVPGWVFNSKHYTYAPSDPRDLHWNDSEANRTWVVQQIASTHANVIVMSRWGDGVNNGAPMQGTLASNDQLFDAVDAVGTVLVMPAIDTFTANGYRDFRTDFPGSPANPSGQLLGEVQDLVTRYGDPRRRRRWAQMYDQDGVPRYAVHWIHAASTYNHDGCAFAEGLDWIANRVEQTRGFRIGFTIDPFNAYLGDGAPRFNCDVGYCPSPYNSCLQRSRSLLGVQGFDPEIVRPGDVASYHPLRDPWVDRWSKPPADANDRMALVVEWKRTWIKDWVATGVPTILDVSPGYDGRYVFRDTGGVIYGDNADYANDDWRNAQSELKGVGVKGAVYNAWNGYTEGLVATPGVWVRAANARSIDGRAPDGLKSWLTDFFSVDPRTCHHVHWVDFGRTKHVVYGAICGKFQEMGGDLSPLHRPVSSELAGCNGARRTLFEHGSIVFSALGTHEVHGYIGEKYRALGYECSGLGPPTSDEEDTGCNDRKRSRFQFGTIVFSRGAPAAYETHGAIAAKYGELGQDCGPLGAPVSDEGLAYASDKISYFESGAIVFSPGYGAHAVYGLIGSLYRSLGYDASWLGPPTSDEKICEGGCAGGRTTDFQHGHIDWCPGWSEARAVPGPSGC